MTNTELVSSNLKRNFTHTTNIQWQTSLINGKNEEASTSTEISTSDFSVIMWHIQIKDIRKQLKKSSFTSGATQQNLGMSQYRENWSSLIFQDISIPFNQLYSLFSYGYIWKSTWLRFFLSQITQTFRNLLNYASGAPFCLTCLRIFMLNLPSYFRAYTPYAPSCLRALRALFTHLIYMPCAPYLCA